MTSLLLALAFAEPTVDVPGIGAVPLADAVATCLDERPVGAVLADKGDRLPALGAMARPLLTSDTATRTATFGIDWPTQGADLDYVGAELVWVPKGVVTSCWAAGRHFVEVGLSLRSACAEGRSGCKEAFADDEQAMVSSAVKGKLKGRHDTMFTALGSLQGLRTWRDPRPLLDKACSLPVQADGREHIVDTDDLAAAHAACAQLLTLIQGDPSPALASIACVSPEWSRAPSTVIPSPESDLGVTDVHVEVQVATILDKLTRMETKVGSCEAPAHGSVWRGGLVARWRDAQKKRACIDNELAETERLRMCPDLVSRADNGCRNRDHASCDLMARLHIDGVGVERDERKALEVWRISCNAAYAPACEAIKERQPILDEWLTEAMAEAVKVQPGQDVGGELSDPFLTAHMLMAQFGAALGIDWVKAAAPPLFDAAIAAQKDKHARDVISLYGPSLGDEWRNDAKTRLGAVEEALKKSGE